MFGANATNADYECVNPDKLYVQCIWWSGGMLMGAPISMTPHKGPYPEFFSRPDDPTTLTLSELTVILLLKSISAFEWVTIIARFVQVYAAHAPSGPRASRLAQRTGLAHLASGSRATPPPTAASLVLWPSVYP